MDALRLILERGSLSGLGEDMDGSGFWLREAESGDPVRWEDDRLVAVGARIVKLAGASYRASELQDPGFEPGKPLAVVPEPDNPHDPHALGIWDEHRRVHAGYVPRDVAATLAEAGELEALSLWEWRSNTGERIGLRVLVFPPGRVRIPPLR
jgi:HIRAN domain